MHETGIALRFERAEEAEVTSPALIERRRFLQRRREEREYARMVGDALPAYGMGKESGSGAGSGVRELRSALSTALNMVVALAASFAIGFYAGRQTDGQERTGYIYGVGAGTLILVVEMVLFIIRASREDGLLKKKL